MIPKGKINQDGRNLHLTWCAIRQRSLALHPNAKLFDGHATDHCVSSVVLLPIHYTPTQSPFHSMGETG